MSNPKFDVDVLDAILFPTSPTAKDRRKDAEAFYNSLPILDRTQTLLQILIQLQSNATTASAPTNDADTSRMNLAAVLLRKEISSLAGDAMKGPRVTSEVLLSMVDPLLGLYSQESIIVDRQSRRALSHCLAELCLSLSMVATHTEAANAIRIILSRIGNACSSGDALSLNLLSNIASRAPVALWVSTTIEDKQGGQVAMGNLLASAIKAIESQQKAGNQCAESLEFLFEAVINVGLASNIAEQAAQSGDSAAVAEVSNAIYSQIKDSGHNDQQSIDANSFAAQLGNTCLIPLLSLILVQPINELCRRCIQHLSSCANRAPSLLAGSKSTLKALVQACLHMSRLGPNEGLELETRVAALEVLATILDCKDVKKILMMEENNNLISLLLLGSEDGAIKDQGVIGLCVQVIVDGVDDDVEAWSEEKPSLQDDSVWEDDDSAIFAEAILERFLHSLGGSRTFPVVLPMLESLAGSSLWKCQRAALSIMEKCLLASPTSFSVHIPVAINAAVSLSNTDNTNIRVKWQCMQLVGTLCTSGGLESVQEPFAGKIFESIARLISTNSCPKVISHACMALVSFCRGDSCGDGELSLDGIDSILLPYLKDLLMALTSGPLAQNFSNPIALLPMNTVLIRAFGALACLADAVGNEFSPFYSDFMPGLVTCAGMGLVIQGDSLIEHNLSHIDSIAREELAELRGTAVESASIVGKAIGSEDVAQFAPDAEKIMSLALPILSKTENSSADISPIPFDQLLAACARIATVMGDRFVPFLPAVVPHLLKRASQEANVSVSEGDEAGLVATRDGAFEHDAKTGTESVTVSVPGMGLKKLTMNTSQMQEKSQAAGAVYELASALGSSFWVYAEACANVFLPLVHFKYSAEVRSTSAAALMAIFKSACEHASIDNSSHHSLLPFLRKLLPMICTSVLEELKNEDEDDWETIRTFGWSLSDVLYASFSNITQDGSRVVILSHDEAHEIVTQIISAVKTCLQRRSKLFENMISDGAIISQDEMNDLEQLLEKDSESLTHLVDSIGYILKSLGPNFINIFDSKVAPTFQPLLTMAGTNDARARFAAVCLFDDCVEHCGTQAAAKHAPALLQGILEGIDDAKNVMDMELKQASIYGVAQIARYAPPSVLSEVALPITQHLEQLIKEGIKQPKDEMENPSLFENAVSAVASLTLFVGSPFNKMTGINISELTELFLQTLPLEQDYGEAKICHEGLCSLIDTGVLDIKSPKIASEIMRIYGECLTLLGNEEEVITSDTKARFDMILRKMQEQLDAPTMQSIFANLAPETQLALQSNI